MKVRIAINNRGSSLYRVIFHLWLNILLLACIDLIPIPIGTSRNTFLHVYSKQQAANEKPADKGERVSVGKLRSAAEMAFSQGEIDKSLGLWLQVRDDE